MIINSPYSEVERSPSLASLKSQEFVEKTDTETKDRKKNQQKSLQIDALKESTTSPPKS